jgi:hypothetical protein
LFGCFGLIIDLDPDRSLPDLVGLWMELNERLGIHVDLVTVQGLGVSLHERVLREAIVMRDDSER